MTAITSTFAERDLFLYDRAPDPDPQNDDTWHERGLCAQTDPEVFFPEKGGSTREAKRICSGCEVKAECLDYALAHEERFGIWGGLSERERRRLRRGEPARPELIADEDVQDLDGDQ